MKYLIIGILLLPIFFWAFQHKKWYLYLTFALYGILPDACAFEISTSLPLITVSRILIVILMIAVLSKKGHFIVTSQNNSGIYNFKYYNIMCEFKLWNQRGQLDIYSDI